MINKILVSYLVRWYFSERWFPSLFNLATHKVAGIGDCWDWGVGPRVNWIPVFRKVFSIGSLRGGIILQAVTPRNDQKWCERQVVMEGFKERGIFGEILLQGSGCRWGYFFSCQRDLKKQSSFQGRFLYGKQHQKKFWKYISWRSVNGCQLIGVVYVNVWRNLPIIFWFIVGR